jgi:hypothetical protein
LNFAIRKTQRGGALGIQLSRSIQFLESLLRHDAVVSDPLGLEQPSIGLKADVA